MAWISCRRWILGTCLLNFLMQCWQPHQDLRFSPFGSILSHFVVTKRIVKVFVQSWPAMMPWISSPEYWLWWFMSFLTLSTGQTNGFYDLGCLFAGQHNLNKFSPVDRCEHCHLSGAEQEGPAGHHCPWCGSNWGMFVYLACGEMLSYWVQLSLKKWSLAMMSEFLHLNSLCGSKHTSFLTLSRDHKKLNADQHWLLMVVVSAGLLPLF